MPTYQELLKQRETLDLQIAETRKQEIADAVSRVRKMVADFGLTASDVFPKAKAKTGTAGTKVAPKYRDPASGATWTGRGKAPKWIAGKNRAPFVIG